MNYLIEQTKSRERAKGAAKNEISSLIALSSAFNFVFHYFVSFTHGPMMQHKAFRNLCNLNLRNVLQQFRHAQSIATHQLDEHMYSATQTQNNVEANIDSHNQQTTRFSEFIRPSFQALLVDAAGTLFVPSEPAAKVYCRYASHYGVHLDHTEVLARYREAYNTPYGSSTIRYIKDAKPFWRWIVRHSLGADNVQDEETFDKIFEDIYEYFARPEAWYVSPGTVDALRRIRQRGIRTAVVSNFDNRLRRILDGLGISSLFDAIVVSSEEGIEKPNPYLFQIACTALQVAPENAIHVGDDRRNDLFGARDAGCFAWLYGADVHNFAEIERRLETGNLYDSISGV